MIPSRPERRQPETSGRDAATFLALIGLLAVAGGLLALCFAVIFSSAFLFIPFFLFGMIGLGVFHYLLWGRRLLRNPLPRDDDDE